MVAPDVISLSMFRVISRAAVYLLNVFPSCAGVGFRPLKSFFKIAILMSASSFKSTSQSGSVPGRGDLPKRAMTGFACFARAYAHAAVTPLAPPVITTTSCSVRSILPSGAADVSSSRV